MSDIGVSGNVLAIDQGTSGTKAIVLSPDRGVLAAVELPLRPTYGLGGAVEQDPQELLDSVVAAGRAAVRQAGEQVVGIGLANQGESVLMWDPATGKAMSPIVVWQDRRAAATCEGISAHTGRLEQISGLALDPYFAAPKMKWLRDSLPLGGVVTTSDAWLVHALTGSAVTDASTASRTMLLDLHTTEWSTEAAEIFGLAVDSLPPVVDCAGQFGATDLFGGGSVPLTGLIVDQQAALFADSCLSAGEAKCTYGTGAFLLANCGGSVTRATGALTPSVAWRLNGNSTYCLDGQVFTAASAVRWLVDLGVIGSAEDLDRVGSQVPDTAGVSFVPALAGLGAPWGRPDALASLTGLSLATSPGHLVRALIEGIAAQVAEMAAAVSQDVGVSVMTLRVDGGLTRSTLLMQSQADLLQIPVEVGASPHATALGAAAFSRLGLDPNLALTAALEPWEPMQTYLPQISADEALTRRAAFNAAVSRLLESAVG
jgi:glycerol kinase